MVENMTLAIYNNPCSTFPIVKETLVNCGKSEYKPANMCQYFSDTLDEVLDGTNPYDVDLCKERVFIDTIYEKTMKDPCHSLMMLKNMNCKEGTISESNFCPMMEKLIVKIEQIYPKFTTINMCNEVVTVSGQFISDKDHGNETSCFLGPLIKKWCPEYLEKSGVGTFGCAVVAFFKPILDNEDLGLLTVNFCDPIAYIMLVCRVVTNMPCVIFGETNGKICEYFNIIKEAINKAIPGLKEFGICSTGEDVYEILKTLFSNPKAFGDMIKAKCDQKETAICKTIKWFSGIPGFFSAGVSCYMHKSVVLFLVVLCFQIN